LPHAAAAYPDDCACLVNELRSVNVLLPDLHHSGATCHSTLHSLQAAAAEAAAAVEAAAEAA
jgi:hypothetical protein